MYSLHPSIQLVVPATNKTPEIIYNRENGEISIIGKSLPEDSKDFYTPVFSLLEGFIAAATTAIKIKVDLEYINTSSCMCLLNFLKDINSLAEKGKTITMDWIHEEEDRDMMEKAKVFQEVINFPINAVKKQELN